ncbi:MAG: hypothetical protein IMZ70_07400, partial [Candidatus Atribacteria bacterium]|nr:hypothetical protein [Candidatus Atribacteria bacterium]
MKRRDFLKLIGTMPFIGGVIAKSTPTASKKDETLPKTVRGKDIHSFIPWRNIWFYADECKVTWTRDLTNWETMNAFPVPTIDYFDYWIKDFEKYGDCLIWVGKNKRMFRISPAGCERYDVFPFIIEYLG